MNSTSSDRATAPSPADRLARLVVSWRGFAPGPKPPAEFDTLRAELNTLANEAESADQPLLARGLSRIALLCEICEYLECEPDHAFEASEVSAFCLGAIDRIVREQRIGGAGVPAVCEELLLRSEDRWGDYLGTVDPAGDGSAVEPELELVEDPGIPEDDAPPELDQATLLRLLQGAGAFSAQPPSRAVVAEEPCRPESRENPPARVDRFAAVDGSPRPLARPEAANAPATPERQGARVQTETAREPVLQIPPLPAQT